MSLDERDASARRAAYADLVTALLDLRSTAATSAFDTALADAVRDGELPESLARQLRSLQRASLSDVIDQAAHVLPATLAALDEQPPGGAQSAAPPGDDTEVVADSDDTVTPPPVDLTARRMLVAGLRPIADPPFP